MDERHLPEGIPPAGEIPAPENEKPAPSEPGSGRFTPSRTELWGALACLVLGWIWFDIDEPLWLLVFVAGFLALGELLHRGTARPKESWVWLGCVLVLTAAIALKRGRAWAYWEEDITTVGFFLHIFAVWWLLSRSGRLAEGESGHLLPYDAFHGFILFPFKHFFLQVRCLWYGVTHIRRGEERIRTATVLWTAGAALAALLLFIKAVELLTAADAGFDQLLGGLLDGLELEFDWLHLLLALPVAAYVFGLVAGTAREDPTRLRQRGARFRAWFETLRRVPAALFIAALAVFSLLYLAFFVLQGRYLFGAFTRTLPEGFVVAEYARQGFFELCRVMALNFALLWLASRLASQPLKENRVLRGFALALLLESLVFAVVAASKLGLYIDCFGFTPRRLESMWLVLVLAAGCLCALYSLCTGKKSFRAWMIFGAVSLSLLCLY